MEQAESDRVARARVEQAEGWRKWCKDAPWLQFPPDLEVSIVPPFSGAMARFFVRFPGGSRHVSVYWDCHDALGFMNKPYWEIHPVKIRSMDGTTDYDCKRFLMGEEPEMMAAIIRSLMDEYDE